MRTLLVSLFISSFAHAATIELVAGGGSKIADAPALECALREPFAVEFLPDGTMVIVEMAKGNRVLHVDKASKLSVLAGTGAKGFAGDGSDPLGARFNGIHNLAITRDGAIFLADSWNYRIRKLDPLKRSIGTIAGTGVKGFGGDGGPAEQAMFSTLIQIALSPDEKHLFIADIDNKRIRRLTLEGGAVITVAGNGKGGIPKDGGVAVEEPLSDPRAVVPARDGAFYILERNGNALRSVDGAGRIYTVAGNGKAGLRGDDGPALDASLNGPKHLCLDRDGTVIIADAENHVIRRYDPKTQRIARVAGTGRKGSAGVGGDPLACELNRPHGVTVGPDGSLYITDSYNDRILRVVSK